MRNDGAEKEKKAWEKLYVECETFLDQRLLAANY